MPNDLIDVEQWAAGMVGLSTAIVDVLRYETTVLHEAVTRGIEDASETIAAALDRAHNHGERRDG